MTIKYVGKMMHLKPFVDSCHKLVNINKIIKINGFSVPKGREELIDGQTATDQKHTKYSIAIRIKNQSFKKNSSGKLIFRKHSYRPMYSILDTLAHELAHVSCWNHSPEHYLLQAKIMVEFSKVAKKLGIKDLELTFDKVF